MLKWIFGILVCVVIILMVVSMYGPQLAILLRTHDPFPAAVRTQLDTLDDQRRRVETLVQDLDMFALSQEEGDYNKLAADANAWLESARRGLELNSVDSVFLTQKFDESLMPKAKALIAKLELMLPRKRVIGEHRMSYIIGGMQEGIKAVTRFADVALAKDAEFEKNCCQAVG